ncbi:vacuolar h+-atpase assembly protein [Phlyctema vagabunda]|uniref:Vacuolar h+-atpase assembly protein n=1 Tax=Phlyctema vagabunda TaxID=108571 RepID=A0ABR4PRI1_9HELO
MVLLTMTHPIVEALEKLQSPRESKDIFPGDGNLESVSEAEDKPDEEEAGNDKHGNHGPDTPRDTGEKAKKLSDTLDEPSLTDPEIGNPISHGQILDISQQLKVQGLSPSTLDVLLRGSRVYLPPPTAKPEPTAEYKALMARLRREEEMRAYERMTNPAPPMETFNQRFPASSAAYAFSLDHQPLQSTDDDEVTYADIDRQMAVVINIVVSVLACAGGLWVIARWWSTPARLALSMTGSILVGIAEIVVYTGYLRKVGDAKGKAKGLQEIKEVINTWTVGGGKDLKEDEIKSQGNVILIEDKVHSKDDTVRKRKKEGI